MGSSGVQFFIHRRPALARGYADALLGIGPFDRTSGLFFTAPWRTGKTTFAKNDLGDELRTRGAKVVYVDLWAGRGRDSTLLIADAIKSALRSLDDPAVRAARRAGLAKAGLGNWASFDLERIGAAGGPTIADANGDRSSNNVGLLSLPLGIEDLGKGCGSEHPSCTLGGGAAGLQHTGGWHSVLKRTHFK